MQCFKFCRIECMCICAFWNLDWKHSLCNSSKLSCGFVFKFLVCEMLFLVKMFLDSRSFGIQFCLTDFPDSYLFAKEIETTYCFSTCTCTCLCLRWTDRCPQPFSFKDRNSSTVETGTRPRNE